MPELIGGALIFVACTAAGFSAAKMYKLRVKQLEAFLRLISHIKAQIEFYRAPLDRIFDGYENEQLEGCGFLTLARSLGAKKAFDTCRNRLYISSSEADELYKFFDGLGTHNVNEERLHCAYFEKTIGDALSSAKTDLPKRTKLCRTFGMLAGVLVAILLI
jgi:stage III sporulation protein AB